MKAITTTALALSFVSLALGCRPDGEFEIDGASFDSKEAVFVTDTQVLDLDQDGDQDDSVTFLSLLVRKKSAAQKDDLCTAVSQVNAAQGNLSAVAGDELLFVQVSQQHLNQTDATLEEGSLSGGELTDAEGNPIDGAIGVFSARKFDNSDVFILFSEGFGTLELKRLSERALSASLVDILSVFIVQDFNGTIRVEERNIPVEGEIQRAEPCETLSTFVPRSVLDP